ncbi:MAG: hypothetical protein JXB17_00730 [Bacteroidales bacterium]|nr:hypothetical protein [Bacteroidales bacterium]
MVTINDKIFEPSDNNLKKIIIENEIIKIIQKENSLNEALQEICNIIPFAYLAPRDISSRILYNNQKYCSDNFKESQNFVKKSIAIPEQLEAQIEIFFLQKDFKLDKQKNTEEIFLENICTLVSGMISQNRLKKLVYENTERLKELQGINRTTEVLKKGMTLEESLQEICSFLPEAWQYPSFTAAKIIFEDKVFKSREFDETPWLQSQVFETPGHKKGVIEIYYLKEFPHEHEGPFLKEERSLIDNLAALISGSATKNALQVLFAQNTERLKELRGINQTTEILKQNMPIEESLQLICSILPDAWQYPEYTAVKIKYKNKVFKSREFIETTWVQKQTFETSGNVKGEIEIYYLKEFSLEDEGPFLKEERNLLVNIANLIAGSATRDIFNKLLNENKERLKELKGINQTSQIIAKGITVDNTLQEICTILPKSWQYPKYTVVRLSFEGKHYISKNFKETIWFQKENFVTIDNKKGSIEVFYLKEFPKEYEGPFLKEERQLLINIGKLLSGYLNSNKGREIVMQKMAKEDQVRKSFEYRESLIKNKQPLQLLLNQQKIDKYIYLEMMKYKVKEILLVATLYDAYNLEIEDGFFERFMGEIYQYSLFSLPRITGVTSVEDALNLLSTTRFDIVIVMVGIDRTYPIEVSNSIKNSHPEIPIYLLLNHKNNLKYFEELASTSKSIEKLFVWNGDSQIFFSIVKSIEDKTNVENDTRIGLVRIILLIEDSPSYYSTYLQILYSIVFGQVQKLLPEVEKNELDKICKMRSRPKILLARNYEDAMYIFNKYKDFFLCVISDVEFEKDGKLNKSAGFDFIKYIKTQRITLPVILQSADMRNKRIAQNLNIHYINKNSQTLLNDLEKILTQYLGFGDFIFRDTQGKPIAVAKSLREFETYLDKIPKESFYLHARKNQFSLWLMARGEIQLAKMFNPVRVDDFETYEECKAFHLELIRSYKNDKKRGKILAFDETSTLDEKNIVSYSSGSLGGKGRGLAFINTLIYNLDFSELTSRINIRTPKTIIIGTDEFENFIRINSLYKISTNLKIKYSEIKKLFVNAKLSDSLVAKLEVFISQINKPVAVRSSSLSEDSYTQPFAGIFDTYIIPYETEDKELLLERLIQSIKLVYASVFSDDARSYFKVIHHKAEEEKMAIVLQELVGNQYNKHYYPHISGIAQSYNFYPVAHMKPEEGFASIALGLGSYVVNGYKSFRFSPKYPGIEMHSTKDLINNSQTVFYALDCSKKNIDYLKDGELAALKLLDISEAEIHGTLNHCASVYNIDNDRIETGISAYGPRILNFADILKYDYIPLAETINVMLNTLKEALGYSVEIEFAVDLAKSENDLPSFYLLQIKPILNSIQAQNVDFKNLNKSKILLYTQSSLGNGEITDIMDLIYIDIEKYDKLKTIEMTTEIEYLNDLMVKQNKQYVLIGPGRWGTRDQFLGIPVNWSQISNAKVIVEISLTDYPLESSLGSHFFHNITSLNIGYFTVLDTSNTDYIHWGKLKKQVIVNRTNHFIHIRFNKPLKVLMNGIEKTAVIIQ